MSEIPTASWMEAIVKQKPSIKLKDLCFIGTHDSAAYRMESFSGAKTGLNAWINDRKIGFLVKLFSSIAVKTQALSIKEQLKAGARYLDLRLAYDEQKKCFFLAHRAACIPFQEALDHITEFQAAHPNELLLISIAGDDEHQATLGGPGVMRQFQQLIHQTFAKNLYTPTQDIPLFEQQLTDMKGKVVISCRENVREHAKAAGLAQDPLFSLDENALWERSWANKPEANSVFEAGQRLLESQLNRNKMIQIDAAPTPDRAKLVLLIGYQISKTLNILYPVLKGLQSAAQYFLNRYPALSEQLQTIHDKMTFIKTHEDNAKAMSKLIHSKLTKSNAPQRGVLYSVDFLGSSTASKALVQACIQTSLAQADIAYSVETKPKSTTIPVNKRKHFLPTQLYAKDNLRTSKNSSSETPEQHKKKPRR